MRLATVLGGGDHGTSTEIVSICPDQRRARRLTVSLASGSALSVHQVVAKRLGLAEGQTVEPRELARTASAEEAQAAWEAGLQLLGYAARSRRELAERLAQRDFRREASAEALSRLAAAGYVNDETFAREWVERRLRQRPCGRRVLEGELLRKGVSRELAAAAIAASLDADTELELATALAQRRLERSNQADERVRRRIYGLLARRGFSAETIREALARALPTAESDSE